MDKVMHVALELLFYLVISLASAAAEDIFCNDIFGKPDFNECNGIALQLHQGWPGEKSIHYDPDPTLFSVLNAKIPSWVNPHLRYHRGFLPKFAGNFNPSPSDQPIVIRDLRLIDSNLGRCKISLMPLRLTTEEIAVDVGYYWSFSYLTTQASWECIGLRGSGGFLFAGMMTIA